MNKAEEILEKHTLWQGEKAVRTEEDMLLAMEEYAEWKLKNCNLQNVSQQRELLYGFSTWHNAKPQKERYDMIYVGEIEDFLKP